jgi:hypothetical protein
MGIYSTRMISREDALSILRSVIEDRFTPDDMIEAMLDAYQAAANTFVNYIIDDEKEDK